MTNLPSKVRVIDTPYEVVRPSMWKAALKQFKQNPIMSLLLLFCCAISMAALSSNLSATDGKRLVITDPPKVAMTFTFQEVGSPVPFKTAKKVAVKRDDVKPYPPQPSDAATYIARFSPVAIAEMKKFGIPASISLAQGLIESKAGESTLAQQNNNHFGVKCFLRNCPKGHCTNHTDDSHKDFFRKYSSAWQSWRDHSKLLSQGRYTRLHKYGRDYRKWAYGLKSVGYATDRDYAGSLIGVIRRYNLDRFDR